MNHAEKRAFVNEMIEILKEEEQALKASGFSSKERIGALQTKSHDAEKAEVAQQQAQAKAMESTTLANEKLDLAYNDASAIVDLLSGLLGKDNELVKKIKKIR